MTVFAQMGLTQAGSPAPGNGGSGVTTSLPTLSLPHVEYRFLLPFLILVGSALALLALSSLIRPIWRRGLYAAWTIVTALAALGWTWHLWGQVVGHGRPPKPGPVAAMSGAFAVDGFGLFITITVCSALALGALLATSYLERERLEGPEFYVLAMLSTSGAVLMGQANDLIGVFLGLEIMSLSLYILTAYHRRRTQSAEAGMKYFVLGAFSSAFFLYGVALIYGATGSTSLPAIASFLSNNVLRSDGVLLAGIGLLVVGLGFKVAAVPFHVWTPDVYQGAPTPATGFMAAVAKTAGFAALFRILLSALPSQSENWRPLIWGLAVLTMVVGAVLAVVQSDVKRILAYSSISHAGYVLLGLYAATASGSIARNGLAGGAFYLLAYTFMIAGSFAVVTAVGGTGDSRHGLDAYRGLGSSRPVLALAFSILLISQAGIPFTTGFIAKFDVISSVVAVGGAPDYALGAIAMIAAVISTYFYLRIILAMYSPATDSPPADDDGRRVVVPAPLWLAIGLCVTFTLVFGVLPGAMIHFAEKASLLF